MSKPLTKPERLFVSICRFIWDWFWTLAFAFATGFLVIFAAFLLAYCAGILSHILDRMFLAGWNAL